MILTSRFLELAENGRLRLIIRPVRDRPLKVGGSYPLQERKREGVDDQKFTKRLRRFNVETGLSETVDAPRETRETKAYVRVVDTVEKHVHEATDQEAKLAGFPGGRWELARWWKDTYDESPMARIRGVERVFDTPARFYFVEPDEERYLAKGTNIPPDPRGYSRTPAGGLADAGAAVEQAYLDRIADGELRSESERQFEASGERERERLRQENRARAARLKEATHRAIQREGVDIADVLGRIDRDIERIKARTASADKRNP